MSNNQVPLVSVVMTVYNGERFLNAAIDSILAQTFTNFELIIVDDASTDSTPTILDGYSDSRLIVLRNETNLGPYKSANKGITVAKGEFIARHDADDVSLPDRFQQQVDRLLENYNLGLLGTSYHMIDGQDRILDTALLPTTNSELQSRLEYGTIFLHGTIMIRRTALEKIGGYRDYFRVSQDYDLFLRLAECGEIANLAPPLYLFRFHGASISRNKRELQLACRGLAWDLAEQRRTTGQEFPIPEDVLKAYPPELIRLFHHARGTAYLYFAAGDSVQATKAINEAQEYFPKLSKDVESWSNWSLSRAHYLAQTRHNVSEGAAFIKWLFEMLEPSQIQSTEKKTLGRFYAEQAFFAGENGRKQQILPYAWQAMQYDKHWISNRGLWVISVKSLNHKLGWSR